VRQAAPAEVQQFEHLVERRRVRRAGCADRRETGEVAADGGARQHRFTRMHAIAVAAHRVDLSVVGHEPERVRQRPGRECVGGEPAVDDRDRAHASLVAQIREVLWQLHCGEHALVGDGPTGQRGKVDAARLGPLAQRVDAAVEVEPADTVGRGDEQLRHVRHATVGGFAEVGAGGVDRQFPPAEYVEALVVGDRLDLGPGRRALLGIGWQKTDSSGERVAAGRGRLGQLEIDHLAEQFDRQLDQDACAVTAVGLGTRGAAVIEMLERDQTVGDDGMRAPALDVGDHRHSAGVGFAFRVVQALGTRQCREQHWDLPPQSGDSFVRDCSGPLGRVYQRSSVATRRESWGPAGTRACCAPPSTSERGRR
jgi:hypothetical protein